MPSQPLIFVMLFIGHLHCCRDPAKRRGMRADLKSTASLFWVLLRRDTDRDPEPLPMHQPKATLEMSPWIAQLIYAESSQYFSGVA